MCEFLVKAVDATNKDKDKDRGGCYKRGDPIECLPDGALWGTHDGPPLAVIIKIPRMSVEEGKKYLQSEWDELVGKKRMIYRRRRYSFDLDNLTKVSDFDTLKNYITDKSIGNTE